MEEKIKHCSVRLPEAVHRAAKLKAYECGMTLQEFITLLIENCIGILDEPGKEFK